MEIIKAGTSVGGITTNSDSGDCGAAGCLCVCTSDGICAHETGCITLDWTPGCVCFPLV